MCSSEVSLVPAQLCSFYSYLKVWMNWEGGGQGDDNRNKKMGKKPIQTPHIHFYLHTLSWRAKNSKEHKNRSLFKDPCQTHLALSSVRGTERGAHLYWKDKTKRKPRGQSDNFTARPQVIFDLFKFEELVGCRASLPVRELFFSIAISQRMFLRKLGCIGG